MRSRHERDTHGKISVSTSPPAKKKRNGDNNKINDSEYMDIDENVLNLNNITEANHPEDTEGT